MFREITTAGKTKNKNKNKQTNKQNKTFKVPRTTIDNGMIVFDYYLCCGEISKVYNFHLAVFLQ